MQSQDRPPDGQQPVGRWACWEWELGGAAGSSDGALTFSLDGRLIPGMTVTAGMHWTAPQTARLWFGHEYTANNLRFGIGYKF